ncbi:NADH-quinone oxidoreductase subunit J [Pedobacter sp.]|uniref:NADH-quinone oxidoreductase subunit J n=1 Tax=Pedobacter sp. TaxID=1411316 RepID=UPI003D7FEDF9
MDATFYITALVALVSTFMVITRSNPVHALLYLVISFLSLALIFFLLGAAFAALLEVIIYAGAIMVLFIFVVMLLNLGRETPKNEREWLNPKVWMGPAILSFILFVEIFYLLTVVPQAPFDLQTIDSKTVAVSLFRPYLLGVELVAMLLMAGVVGAAHIGQHKKQSIHRFLKEEE